MTISNAKEYYIKENVGISPIDGCVNLWKEGKKEGWIKLKEKDIEC